MCHTHNQGLAVGGRAGGIFARQGVGEGGLGAWLQPDTPSGTPAAAAETVLQAASASVAPSGSDTHTHTHRLLTPSTHRT